MRQSELGRNDFVPWIAASHDGETWHAGRPVWPHLTQCSSIFVSLSCDSFGRLYLYGTRTPIDQPGERFWCDETQGLKQNELICATSDDGGNSWTEPRLIPMPIAGAAEAPGPLCVVEGIWFAVYAPYKTFDPALFVDRDQIVMLRSVDMGATWSNTAMLRFPQPHSGGAEAWIARTDAGRLVGTAWHIDHAGEKEYPNAYAISEDGGATWSPTRSTGTLGQSTGLTPWTAGRILFLYNQRRHGIPGVWLAVACPAAGSFGIEHQELIWRASVRTRSQSSGEHSDWTDFSFGEPSAAVLSGGRLLVVMWCIQPEGAGIQYVVLQLHE